MSTSQNPLDNPAAETTEAFIDKIQEIGEITSKKMFGGYGIFHSKKMFALVNAGGDLFLKANEETRQKFEKADSHQHAKMPYYSVPPNIMKDPEKLVRWTKESIEISK